MHEPLGNGERRGCENGQSRTAEAGGELLPPGGALPQPDFLPWVGPPAPLRNSRGLTPSALRKL